MPERYPHAAAAIASLDEENRQIVLLRLAAQFNNGEQHFDHSDTPGAYSWLCLACAQSGRGPFYVEAASMGLAAPGDPANETGSPARSEGAGSDQRRGHVRRSAPRA